jgi:hypothetical protein
MILNKVTKWVIFKKQMQILILNNHSTKDKVYKAINKLIKL